MDFGCISTTYYPFVIYKFIDGSLKAVTYEIQLITLRNYIIARTSIWPLASKIDTHDHEGVISIPTKFQTDNLIILGDTAIFVVEG